MGGWNFMENPDKFSDFIAEMAMRNVRQGTYSFLVDDMGPKQCGTAINFLELCKQKLNGLIDAEITKINQKSKEREGKR